MNRISTRQSWLMVVVAATIVAVGVGLAIRTSPVVGQNVVGDEAFVQAKAQLAAEHAHSPLKASDKTPADLKNAPALNHANALSKAFRDAAEVATPSVVTIHSQSTTKAVKGMRGDNPLGRGRTFRGGENPFKGTPFEHMIPEGALPEGMLPEGMEEMPFPSPGRSGVGSGVIINKDGLVLTNNHVVEGADSVMVRLADGREFKATDIKTDPHTDIAVLRIKADGDLPAAHLGNSDELAIGDWVIAIGCPFELDQTVSAGIISGKGRELGSVRRAKFLQTDAAINPGNSGGPLVNLNGEVIGINTAIASNSGGYQGIGFAVPINTAKWITGQLVKDGSVKRGYLGVGIGEVTADLAGKFGVAKGQGVLVGEVFPNSPAADAKLNDGDVIIKFSGQAVRNPRELQELVERAPLDVPQPVEVIRDGKPLTVNVTVKSLPEKFGAVQRPARVKPVEESPATYEAKEMGLTVAEMSAEQREAFAGYEGVVVAEVVSDGVAAEKGLRPGMLIRKVGKTNVANLKEFESAVKGESLKDGVLLSVRTTAGNRFVVLQAS